MGTKTRRILIKEDIESFICEQSNFAFELEVLHELVMEGFKCQHGGTYTDPVTGKNRQFDIRASKQIDDTILNLAIECKNISENTPLLAHCVSRNRNESYYESLSYHYDHNKTNSTPSGQITVNEHRNELYGYGKDSYRSCKDLSQLWEEEVQKSKILVSRDNEVFDKWTQALCSCTSWITEQVDIVQYGTPIEEERKLIFIPILIIPENTLWKTSFSEEGVWHEDVSKTDHVSLFIDKEIRLKTENRALFKISHLEVITFNSFKSKMKRMCESLSHTGKFYGTVFN